MDEWLRAKLAYLQPVSADAGAAAMRLVDGVWWDSRARLPYPRLVLRRNTDAGVELSPWVVPRACASPAMQAWVDRHCGGAEHPLTLRRGSAIDGHAFEEFATLEIDVHVPDPFPFPRAGSTRITQENFPVVLQPIRFSLPRPREPSHNSLLFGCWLGNSRHLIFPVGPLGPICQMMG